MMGTYGNPDASSLLTVFAKYWQVGTVKTRLGQTIGMEQAAAVHREFVTTTLRRYQTIAGGKCVCYAPAEREADFAALAGPGWRLVAQSEGDLGQRLSDFFGEMFTPAVERVVVIGSDSPDLPRAYVEQALDRLRECPVVLGPTSDGGYYLIGLARPIPELFQQISWGTSAVWPQTVDRLRQLGLPFTELPRWYDVDERQDLARLLDVLQPAADQELAALRRRLQQILENGSTWTIV